MTERDRLLTAVSLALVIGIVIGAIGSSYARGATATSRSAAQPVVDDGPWQQVPPVTAEQQSEAPESTPGTSPAAPSVEPEATESAVRWPEPAPASPSSTVKPAAGSSARSVTGAANPGATALPIWYVTRTGIISHMGTSWPGPYLAIPRGPGFRVTICGPAACVTMRSTDAGPNKAMIDAGRIADLDWRTFEVISGQPASRGLTVGTWTIP